MNDATTKATAKIGLRGVLEKGFTAVEGGLDRIFTPRLNPLTQLGALGYFYFWIVSATGIYLYILFGTSVASAYVSVEYMTVQQWYFGGIMRSLHRYASDALVITMMLHLLREYAFDRYRGVRWFTWFTGVPLLWLTFAAGISGYWLVWDQLAQYIATATFEWLDWIPIFGEPIANNFLTRGSMDDRFFTLLIFLHIFLPLTLLFVMWIHVLRISRPKVNPPIGLALGTIFMLTVLSFFKPALSHPPADLGVVPELVQLDWYYLFVYPLIDHWPAGIVWVGLVGVSTFLCFMPWMPPIKRPSAAQVFDNRCNGCKRCFEDCPYGAVIMGPRTDGRPYPHIAIVNSSLCTGCGICVGACPTATPFRTGQELVTGIDLPDLTLQNLRTQAVEAMNALKGDRKIIVFGCDHGVDVEALQSTDTAAIRLPCIGMLPPPFIDFALSRGGIEGVFLTGCRPGECYQRLGVEWTEARIDRTRDPYLRERVPRDRLGMFWAAPSESQALKEAIETFRKELKPTPRAKGGENA